jgi:hypothetical protein
LEFFRDEYGDSCVVSGFAGAIRGGAASCLDGALGFHPDWFGGGVAGFAESASDVGGADERVGARVAVLGFVFGDFVRDIGDAAGLGFAEDGGGALAGVFAASDL